MPHQSLEEFRQQVLQDLSLQERLRNTTDREDFTNLMVELGQENGYNFTAEDVVDALQVARRAWFQRWI